MKIATFLFVALISPVNPRPSLSDSLLVIDTQMCLIGISNITCPWSPSRVLRCLFHWVIISRGSFLGNCIWGISQGCVGKGGLLEAKGGEKKGRLGAKLP